MLGLSADSDLHRVLIGGQRLLSIEQGCDGVCPERILANRSLLFCPVGEMLTFRIQLFNQDGIQAERFRNSTCLGHIAKPGTWSQRGYLPSERYDTILVHIFWKICTPRCTEDASKG